MTRPASRVGGRWPEIGWLTLVWVLLWGSFTPLTIVGGVLVAALVTALFRLPTPAERLPVRPWRLVRLLGYLVRDLLVSGGRVSWQTLRYGPAALGAIVEVPLVCSSDRIVTILSIALSISPGSSVLQIDHEHGRFFVYALGPRDAAGVEQARQEALTMQVWVLQAFGTADEIERARRGDAGLSITGEC